MRNLSIGPALGGTLRLLRGNSLLFVSIAAIPGAFLIFFALTMSFAVDLSHAGPVNLSPTLKEIFQVAILVFVVLLHRACAATVFSASELQLGRQATFIRAHVGRRSSLLTLWLSPVVIGLLGLSLIMTVALLALVCILSGPVFAVAFSEDLKTFEALRRASALTTGNYRPIFLVVLLSFLLGAALLSGLTVTLGILGGFVGSPPWVEAVIGVFLAFGIALPLQLVLVSLTVAYRSLSSQEEKEIAVQNG